MGVELDHTFEQRAPHIDDASAERGVFDRCGTLLQDGLHIGGLEAAAAGLYDEGRQPTDERRGK